jgi:hypothetical protein
VLKQPSTTTRDGICNVKKWSNFNERMAICIVPTEHKEDKALGQWVARQRRFHTNNKMRQDRKDPLDELDFVWSLAITDNNVKKRHQQCKTLVDFNRKNGHCLVPINDEQDNTFTNWVKEQRYFYINNKRRPDRKELSNELEFADELPQ